MAKFKNAAVTLTASGDTTVIAAPGAGKAIQIYALHVQPDAAVSFILKAGTTSLTGPVPQVAGGGWVYQLPPYDPTGNTFWFEGGDNEAIKINQSGAVNSGGVILYRVKTL